MSDLTTLAKVKEWLGEATAANDSVLTRLIAAASDYIQAWLSRDIMQAAYVSARDGTGGNRLMFRNYPVTAVTQVKIDGIVIPASVNGSNGYVFNETALSLIGYRFTKGFSNVNLSYTAGFAVVPNEIEQACIEMVSLRFKEKARIGVVSKSMSGETITFSQKDMSDTMESTLMQYRRVMMP
jgi:hypothetical protein